MSLAEALASLEETAEHRELRRVIAGLCLDSQADHGGKHDIAQEAAHMLQYCDGERLERTGAAVLSVALDDTDRSGPKTVVTLAEKVSA